MAKYNLILLILSISICFEFNQCTSLDHYLLSQPENYSRTQAITIFKLRSFQLQLDDAKPDVPTYQKHIK